MSALRPLPSQPNLEFERKEAKALLRRLRAGDPDALARAHARHAAITALATSSSRLADAQLVIAREYGFASWPRLVRYFGDVERQRHNVRSIPWHRLDFYEGSVRNLLAGHRNRSVWTGRAIASYVPRFYGVSVNDVFDSTITEDDVRLVVARQYGYSNWELLLERIAAEAGRPRRDEEWDVDPMQYASVAMKAGNLSELQRVVEAHPELLHPSKDDVAQGGTLIRSALHHEREQGHAALRPIMAWLAAHGFDRQLELNRQLCGHKHMKPDKVRDLLDRGADPNWVAPNGIPVLEHALIRYWNGEAVDVLAARTTPRNALWIAAGLGDVDGVRGFLDAEGRPTHAARRLRPDFDAVDSIPVLCPLPDPDDEEILMEVFFVAMLNGRTAVLEYMVSRGVPVNSLVYGTPVINIAVGNAWTPVVECLVRCGADLDLRGRSSRQSARELAREIFLTASEHAHYRRVVELCGMDPDAILAERDARRVRPPTVEPKLQEALQLANDDASRRGQSDVHSENLLFGLLRSGGLPAYLFNKVSRIDLERFRADVEQRVHPAEDGVDRPRLPLSADAQAMFDAAIAIATERRRDTVNGLHLLYALTREGQGPAADLLARYGSSAATLNAALERSL